MDVREKLVDLIFDSLCRHIDKSCNLAENIADDLIRSGVTVQENVEMSDELLKQLKNAPITICKEEPSIELVQEWISVDDKYPPYNRDVLVYRPNMAMKIVVDTYDGYYGDDDDEWYEGWALYGKDTHGNPAITHWSYLPKPPKGE